MPAGASLDFLLRSTQNQGQVFFGRHLKLPLLSLPATGSRGAGLRFPAGTYQQGRLVTEETAISEWSALKPPPRGERRNTVVQWEAERCDGRAQKVTQVPSSQPMAWQDGERAREGRGWSC